MEVSRESVEVSRESVEVSRDSVGVSRESVEVQRVSATYISAIYFTYMHGLSGEGAKVDVKKMLTLDDLLHIKI